MEISVPTPNNPDDWSGVQDPRKRKQIQDRLAQRARRKRLSELDPPSDNTKHRKPGHSAQQLGENMKAAGQHYVDFNNYLNGPDAVQALKTEVASRSQIHELSTDLLSTYLPIPATTSDERFIPDPSLSVYAALFKNGAMMGLVCGDSVPIISRPAGPELPPALHPTDLQISILHSPWIDRFPFPRMRDNMILLDGLIDEEVFLADLFTLPSFELRAGSLGWDPSGWRIGREFAAKWGYLFY